MVEKAAEPNHPIYRLSVAGSTGLEAAITGNHNYDLQLDQSPYAVLRMSKNQLLDDVAGVTSIRPNSIDFR